MSTPILTAEYWRLIIFIGLLLSFMSLEALYPRKIRQCPRHSRWLTNLSLSFINMLVLRLLGPISAVSVAYWASGQSWGLLNQFDLSPILAISIGLIILDLAIYLQHVAFHYWPFLWQLHQVHHVDRDLDATTAIRFHPIEIMVSMLYKIALVLILGPSAFTVILFETLLNAMALFNHANLKLPLWLDRILRIIVVTPDMHRVHHSVIVRETNSNFGFNLSLWDRIFKTYKSQPQDGHDNMIIGLKEHQDAAPTRLGFSLVLPFKTKS